MLYSFRLLLFLINIDQETVLNWFGVTNPNFLELNRTIESGYEWNSANFRLSSDISIDTFRILVEDFWYKFKDGLTLADIESILFFVLFLRFIILALRYNLKTSLYITGIGLFAGYLWYKHLIDLISMYRGVLLNLPFLNKLGMDAVQLRSLHEQMILTDIKLGENANWYNPGRVLYYAFTRAIINYDSQTGLKYYIDPISMIISKLQEPVKTNILSFYYTLYNVVIPKIYEICSKFWAQLSSVAAYAVITRIGKRYCPYLIRWHWTFLLIIGLIEQILIYFIYRVYYFQSYVLIPQAEASITYVDPNLLLQINILNSIITYIVLLHIGFVIFGLLHAVCGQYFYIPFFVENTELHIGLKPKDSLYSGGYTSWQDSEEKKKNFDRVLPKLWYGWFGRGTTNNSLSILNDFSRLFRKIYKKFIKQFRR
jgi:hypothetical protein